MVWLNEIRIVTNVHIMFPYLEAPEYFFPGDKVVSRGGAGPASPATATIAFVGAAPTVAFASTLTNLRTKINKSKIFCMIQ